MSSRPACHYTNRKTAKYCCALDIFYRLTIFAFIIVFVVWDVGLYQRIIIWSVLVILLFIFLEISQTYIEIDPSSNTAYEIVSYFHGTFFKVRTYQPNPALYAIVHNVVVSTREQVIPTYYHTVDGDGVMQSNRERPRETDKTEKITTVYTFYEPLYYFKSNQINDFYKTSFDDNTLTIILSYLGGADVLLQNIISSSSWSPWKKYKTFESLPKFKAHVQVSTDSNFGIWYLAKKTNMELNMKMKRIKTIVHRTNSIQDCQRNANGGLLISGYDASLNSAIPTGSTCNAPDDKCYCRK